MASLLGSVELAAVLLNADVVVLAGDNLNKVPQLQKTQHLAKVAAGGANGLQREEVGDVGQVEGDDVHVLPGLHVHVYGDHVALAALVQQDLLVDILRELQLDLLLQRAERLGSENAFLGHSNIRRFLLAGQVPPFFLLIILVEVPAVPSDGVVVCFPELGLLEVPLGLLLLHEHLV